MSIIKKIKEIFPKKLKNKDIFEEYKRKYLAYLEDPKPFTDEAAHLYQRFAFVNCEGKNLLWAWKLQQKLRPHHSKEVKSTIFPELQETDIIKAVSELKRNGYYILPWKMPESWVESIRTKAGELDVVARSKAPDVQKPKSIHPQAATYWHGEDIFEIQELRELAGDRGIKEIIDRYLGTQSELDLVASWWTFPKGEPDSSAAQLYHFDLDRVRWIKVFVYLSDVGIDNGPHAFVRGSHNTIGEKINRDGRFSDEEVFSLYPRSEEVVFTAPSGTIFLEDTLGFHKGIPAKEGHRFVFEFQYSINSFGAPYKKIKI